ncbi:MAG: nucleotide exchange factor GrpE [Lachnospiraceae bacterium]|nr:nucleotide exchange factor GrpE [Lachnospiraceae bacterium]
MPEQEEKEADAEETVTEEAAEETAAESETEPDAGSEAEEPEKAEEDKKEEDRKEEAPEQEEAPEKEEKKGFFGKKKDKEKAALQEKIAELEDRTKRQMAEFENFRRRTDKEKSQMFSNGEMNVLEKMLPIIDNFERGFDTITEEDQEDAFVDGMRKIYAQLLKQMEDLGVTPIEAIGKEFDPNFHNAVMQVESEEYESGIVAQELLKGYMYHDSVLRHSMVGVVQ